jgi:hypothetical protein
MWFVHRPHRKSIILTCILTICVNEDSPILGFDHVEGVAYFALFRQVWQPTWLSFRKIAMLAMSKVFVDSSGKRSY